MHAIESIPVSGYTPEQPAHEGPKQVPECGECGTSMVEVEAEEGDTKLLEPRLMCPNGHGLAPQHEKAQ
ncbi:MAG: hypothetical protein AAB490_02720 [Patescibacteria group bacterium]|mgnify:CR=1 FL=1